MIPFAHALASKGDLPIPAWLFAWGAAIVLVVSFFGLAAAWRKPKFEGDEWRPIAPRFSAVLLSWSASSGSESCSTRASSEPPRRTGTSRSSSSS